MFEILEAILFFGVFIVVIACFLFGGKDKRYKSTDGFERMPLYVSKEVFFARFRFQIMEEARKKRAFTGELRPENRFVFEYWPLGRLSKPRPLNDGLLLQGEIEVDEIAYRVVGRSNRPTFEKERLEQKLRELCAPEPGTIPKAE